MTEGVAVFRDVSEVLQGELTKRDAGDLYGRTVSLSLCGSFSRGKSLPPEC